MFIVQRLHRVVTDVGLLTVAYQTPVAYDQVYPRYRHVTRHRSPSRIPSQDTRDGRARVPELSTRRHTDPSAANYHD